MSEGLWKVHVVLTNGQAVRLSFNNEFVAECAFKALTQPDTAAPVVVTDSYGTTGFVARGHMMAVVMEDCDLVSRGNAEDVVYQKRTQARAQHRVQADPLSQIVPPPGMISPRSFNG